MPGLADVTDPEAIEAALAEFRAIGRQRFLNKYDLNPSRDYFIQVGAELFDSKPILAVAYGNQHPDRGPLSIQSFSGGTGGAVRALRRLGYNTVTVAQLTPPVLGDTYLRRSDIQDRYGGDNVAGIIRFPGESAVNIFSDSDGPYSDDEPTLLVPFGYRGEGLEGPQRLSQRGNQLMEQCRLGRHAARFWYRPPGGAFSFYAWVVVITYSWIQGVGQDGVERQEIEWILQAVPNPQVTAWPATVTGELDDSVVPAAEDHAAIEADVGRTVTYDDLLRRLESLDQMSSTDAGKSSRNKYRRRVAARRAVLIRSRGSCEGSRCTGMPGEQDRNGNPILDVDHVIDLGHGGSDHPLNMVALCPNCHACKTRGGDTSRRRRELLAVARTAHEVATASGGAAPSV